MNHTATNATIVTSPERSAYLYWVSGISGQEAINKSIGPAINLKVQAGDKLDISAWVKYEKKASYTRGMPQSLLATVLGGTFAFTYGMETVPQAVSTFNSGLPTFMGITSGDADTRPFAYLNYMLFNNNFTMVDAGAIRVPTTAGFDPGNEATSQPARLGFQPITVTTTGYIYIWVSNETEATKVWFDDLKVSHTQDIVTQTTDYGSWGGIVREQRTNVLEDHRYAYQGEFAEKDLETGWEHFELREYDPVIGRTLTMDPEGQFYSPYLWVGNNPVTGIDPTGGDCPTCPKGGQYDQYINANGDFTFDPESGIVVNGIGLDNIVIRPDFINGSFTPIQRSGYYGPPKDFGVLQDQAAYEGALVLSVGYALFKSQFVAENTSDDPNVNAMSAPMPGKINISKIAQQLKAAQNARKLVIAGRAPKGILRVDTRLKTDPNGVVLHGQKPHVHFKSGALNIDGTWKHLPDNEAKTLTNSIKQWLVNNGWDLPK